MIYSNEQRYLPANTYRHVSMPECNRDLHHNKFTLYCRWPSGAMQTIWDSTRGHELSEASFGHCRSPSGAGQQVAGQLAQLVVFFEFMTRIHISGEGAQRRFTVYKSCTERVFHYSFEHKSLVDLELLQLHGYCSYHRLTAACRDSK